MPPRDWRERAADMLAAIARVQRYTQGMDFETFAADERTVDAVVRNLAIIGEAARHIPTDVLDRHPGVSWYEVRAMRNVLTHEYFRVGLHILWDTIQQDLPSTVRVLQEMLKEP